jgi:ribonuclease-3
MGIGKDLFELMKTIEYTFSDASHLEIALTHTSYSNEMKKKGFRAQSNEAYEFMGDAVLELIISEELFNGTPKNEGIMTKQRQSLVCEGTLARIAKSISLGDYLNIGTSEENTDLRNRDKILADSLEALICAIYFDSRDIYGLSVCRDVVKRLYKDEIKRVSNSVSSDYKSMLQQFVEQNSGSVLVYEYEDSGPEHEKKFTAVAFINNNPVGRGEGKTKRTAETAAAKSALKLFGII